MGPGFSLIVQKGDSRIAHIWVVAMTPITTCGLINEKRNQNETFTGCTPKLQKETLCVWAVDDNDADSPK